MAFSTAVNVVETLNVVLAEIAADLHLDQFERNLARIGQTMREAQRAID